MGRKDVYRVDDIDREILQLLIQDPRMPYSEISKGLEEVGYDMSSEGVRHRVTKLLDESTIFMLPGPQGNEWEVIRVNISVTNEPDAKEQVFQKLSDQNFWLVCRGIGTSDLHAVATISSIQGADELVAEVRGYEGVDSVDYFLESERESDMHKYFGTLDSI